MYSYKRYKKKFSEYKEPSSDHSKIYALALGSLTLLSGIVVYMNPKALEVAVISSLYLVFTSSIILHSLNILPIPRTLFLIILTISIIFGLLTLIIDIELYFKNNIRY